MSQSEMGFVVCLAKEVDHSFLQCFNSFFAFNSPPHLKTALLTWRRPRCGAKHCANARKQTMINASLSGKHKPVMPSAFVGKRLRRRRNTAMLRFGEKKRRKEEKIRDGRLLCIRLAHCRLGRRLTGHSACVLTKFVPSKLNRIQFRVCFFCSRKIS